MGLKWNKVTWYSQLIAIVLFLAVFGLGYWLGGKTTGSQNDTATEPTNQFVMDFFTCAEGRTIETAFFPDQHGNTFVDLELSDTSGDENGTMTLDESTPTGTSSAAVYTDPNDSRFSFSVNPFTSTQTAQYITTATFTEPSALGPSYSNCTGSPLDLMYLNPPPGNYP